MAAFVSQNVSDPYSRFAGALSSQMSVREQGSPGESDTQELSRTIRGLMESFAVTNKLLASTYGNGIVDRRNGQSYYIDVGFTLPQITNVPGDPVASDVRVLVNTSKISELVSPSLGEVDVKFAIGIDSYSIHRYDMPPSNKIFPITLVCDKLQESSGARYLALLNGEFGTALNPAAQSIVYGDMPSSLEFRIGFMDVVPVDSQGTLNRTVYPLCFNGSWPASIDGLKAPRVPGAATELLWGSANVYAMTIRLYVIPTISPRVRVNS